MTEKTPNRNARGPGRAGQEAPDGRAPAAPPSRREMMTAAAWLGAAGLGAGLWRPWPWQGRSLGAAPTPPEAPRTVIANGPVLPPELADKVRKRVGELVEKLVEDTGENPGSPWSKSGTPIGFREIRSLALMQALPYLDGTARERSSKATRRLLEAAQGDYFDPQPAGAVRSFADLSAPKWWTLSGDSDRRCYRLPFALMLFEHWLAGGLEQVGDGGPTLDRAPHARLGLDDFTQRQVVRLLAVLLAKDGSFDGTEGDRLSSQSLWAYTTFGGGAHDTSASGTAAVGVAIAIGLGFADFADGAFDFEFPGVAAGGDRARAVRKRVEDRLTDALAHCLRLLTTDDPAKFPYVHAGRDGLATHGDAPDLDAYRTIRSTGEDGRPMIQVEATRPEPQCALADKKWVAYRYNTLHSAYTTAAAGYVLAVTANLLDQWLTARERRWQRAAQADRGTMGKSGSQYPLQRTARSKWECKIDGATWVFQPRGVAAGRYTRLAVGVGGTPLELNDRIKRVIGSVIGLLCDRKAGGEAKGATASLGQYPEYWSYCAWSVMKLLLACGHDVSAGPWPWWRDLAEWATAGAAPGPDAQGTPEFALLLLTRSYRPLYPRDHQ